MRKYIVGFLAGVLLTFTTSVYGAEVVNLIGKKVQGEVSVSVDGTGIGKAVVIDGKSYAPVRAIGESAGYSVSVKGKDVSLSKPAAEIAKDDTMTPEKIKSILDYAEKDRDDLLKRIAKWESALTDPLQADKKQSIETTIKNYKASLEKTEQRIAELEAQLAELQGQ